ncbi:MAG: hypothetical protein HY895_09720 [Deltaproteobacteria bacterium]|nr:hypothetical protein [Deltaproteobacteria bacterium]
MAGWEAWRWDVVCNAIQIAMCSVILVVLIRNKLKTKRFLAEGEGRDRVIPFTQEIRLQSIRQQTELALEVILKAVQAEQLRLQQTFDGADARLPGAGTAADAASAEHLPFRLGEDIPPVSSGSSAGRYEGVLGLAGEGLSAKQIAEQLRLPSGEVELALKLRRAAS